MVLSFRYVCVNVLEMLQSTLFYAYQCAQLSQSQSNRIASGQMTRRAEPSPNNRSGALGTTWMMCDESGSYRWIRSA